MWDHCNDQQPFDCFGAEGGVPGLNDTTTNDHIIVSI